MSANITPATPTKLKDGSWGARVEAAVTPGDRIEIHTKSGKSWTALVDKILWQGEGKSIVSTSRDSEPLPSAARPVRRQRAPRRRRPCGYPGCDGIHYCDECSD